LRSRAGVSIGRVLAIARGADLMLVVFLVCLAFTTAAQVRHNEAAGPRGHAPYDRPLRLDRPVR
jgi:hypothetical protein